MIGGTPMDDPFGNGAVAVAASRDGAIVLSHDQHDGDSACALKHDSHADSLGDDHWDASDDGFDPSLCMAYRTRIGDKAQLRRYYSQDPKELVGADGHDSAIATSSDPHYVYKAPASKSAT